MSGPTSSSLLECPHCCEGRDTRESVEADDA